MATYPEPVDAVGLFDIEHVIADTHADLPQSPLSLLDSRR